VSVIVAEISVKWSVHVVDVADEVEFGDAVVCKSAEMEAGWMVPEETLGNGFVEFGLKVFGECCEWPYR